VESVLANAITALRTLFDSISPSTGWRAAIDVTFRMRPHRLARIPGTTARANPTALVSNVCTAASRHAHPESA
jgi:hypothetical protein